MPTRRRRSRQQCSVVTAGNIARPVLHTFWNQIRRSSGENIQKPVRGEERVALFHEEIYSAEGAKYKSLGRSHNPFVRYRLPDGGREKFLRLRIVFPTDK
jgi:hypothetical protein